MFKDWGRGVTIPRKRKMSKAVQRERRSLGGREAVGPEPRTTAPPHPVPAAPSHAPASSAGPGTSPHPWAPASGPETCRGVSGPAGTRHRLFPTSTETLAAANRPANTFPAPAARSARPRPALHPSRPAPLAPGAPGHVRPPSRGRGTSPRAAVESSLLFRPRAAHRTPETRDGTGECPGISATSGAARGASAEQSRETAPPGRSGRSRLAAAAAAGLALRPSPARAALTQPGSGPPRRVWVNRVTVLGSRSWAREEPPPFGLLRAVQVGSAWKGFFFFFLFQFFADSQMKLPLKESNSFRISGAKSSVKVNCPSDLSWKVGNFLSICLFKQNKTKQKFSWCSGNESD